jgi:hypothetical protein
VGPVGAADDLRRRIEGLRASPAYRAYENVRESVLRLKDLESASRSPISEPSAYWREELANFEYMLDASPLMVEKLRHHCYHITGLHVYDYRSNQVENQRRFEDKLAALIEVGGKELLLPELRLLGGFGFEIDGALYNLDTLKFYEALIALQQGALLSDFRNGPERRVVWEIGAGWGGFAYQFKSLCPNVTYIISDFPELFLFSAVYLMAVFPDAQVAFCGCEPPERVFQRWQEIDFIFVPNTLLSAVNLERLDLTINMVSFQEMTDEQVRAYVKHAFARNCPYLYSLNRDRSPYNLEQTGVRSIIQEYYWPHEITVLPMSYQRMLDEAPQPESRAPSAKKKPDLDYKHLVGWRRMLV